MLKKKLKLIILTVALLFCHNIETQAATISSTFDSGLDGWTSNDGLQSISNQGGYIRITDLSSSFLYAIAPEIFHGNWSNFNTISADILGETYTNWRRAVVFEISNAGNKATHTFNINDIVNNEWRTLSVNIDSNDWTITEGNWNSLISNVTDFRLQMDLKKYTLNEYNGIDNVILTNSSVPAPVPEPSSIILGTLGALGLLRRRNKKF